MRCVSHSQKQLSEFDGLTADVIAVARSDASQQLRIKQTYEKLHLKELQLKVTRDAAMLHNQRVIDCYQNIVVNPFYKCARVTITGRGKAPNVITRT